MEEETLILNHAEIMERIKRIAWQIYEDNCDEASVVLIGIPKRGLVITKLIADELRRISPLKVITGEAKEPDFKANAELKDHSVVLVDDVLNSGRTMMKAAGAIMLESPKQLRTAILANRDHKRYPIGADFVGISLATTRQEHISFESSDPNKLTVTLQ